MKVLLGLLALLAVSSVYLYSAESQKLTYEPGQRIMMAYQAWKSKYGLNYNGSEEEYRFQNFQENYRFIENHNSIRGKSLLLGLTQFAAMTNEEFRQTMVLKTKSVKPERVGTEFKKTGASVPDSLDWQKKGAVYETQNQGSCGSCWAFATIGGLQGLRYINEGVLELLSAQQVTSCVPAEYLDDKTQGCGGGEAQYAYAYTAENGIETWEDYPYVNGSGGVAAPCEYNKDKVVFQNQGVGFVPHNDVDGMLEAIQNQPLSIAVDAGSIYFQLYNSGVIKSENCGTELNHAILMVGYDKTGSEPYWRVQNSWGTGWGENGFGKILMTKEGDGICGINMQVDYPERAN